MKISALYHSYCLLDFIKFGANLFFCNSLVEVVGRKSKLVLTPLIFFLWEGAGFPSKF